MAWPAIIGAIVAIAGTAAGIGASQAQAKQARDEKRKELEQRESQEKALVEQQNAQLNEQKRLADLERQQRLLQQAQQTSTGLGQARRQNLTGLSDIISKGFLG